MTPPNGPGTPFELLFSDVSASQPSLPASFRDIYPGDWHMPDLDNRPYVFTNFATARDGRVSFAEPGISDGGTVTSYNAHDRWLMGLLRMRADAVLNGDGTVNTEPDHTWTAEFICPDDAEAFAAQRKAEGYKPRPLLVILSYNGRLDPNAACLESKEVHLVIATTTAGKKHAQTLEANGAVDILDLGEHTADLHRLVDILYQEYGIRHLLCEGGPRVFAGMLDAGLVDEEFVTLCPTFIGRSPAKQRPSYTEGVAWQPDTAPYSKPISLHRAGDFLFMRTRCQYR